MLCSIVLCHTGNSGHHTCLAFRFCFFEIPAQAAPGAYVPPPVGTKNGMAQATAPVAGQPPHAAAPYPAATPYPPATAPVQGVANPMFPAAGAAMAQAPPAYPEAPQQPAGNLGE